MTDIPASLDEALEQIANCRVEIENLQAKNEQLSEWVERNTEERTELASRLQRAERQVRKLTEDNKSLKASAVASKNQQPPAQAAKTQGRDAELISKLQARDRTIQTLQAELSKTKKSLAQTQSQLKEAQDRNNGDSKLLADANKAFVGACSAMRDALRQQKIKHHIPFPEGDRPNAASMRRYISEGLLNMNRKMAGIASGTDKSPQPFSKEILGYGVDLASQTIRVAMLLQACCAYRSYVSNGVSGSSTRKASLRPLDVMSGVKVLRDAVERFEKNTGVTIPRESPATDAAFAGDSTYRLEVVQSATAENTPLNFFQFDEDDQSGTEERLSVDPRISQSHPQPDSNFQMRGGAHIMPNNVEQVPHLDPVARSTPPITDPTTESIQGTDIDSRTKDNVPNGIRILDDFSSESDLTGSSVDDNLPFGNRGPVPLIRPLPGSLANQGANGSAIPIGKNALIQQQAIRPDSSFDGQLGSARGSGEKSLAMYQVEGYEFGESPVRVISNLSHQPVETGRSSVPPELMRQTPVVMSQSHQSGRDAMNEILAGTEDSSSDFDQPNKTRDTPARPQNEKEPKPQGKVSFQDQQESSQKGEIDAPTQSRDDDLSVVLVDQVLDCLAELVDLTNNMTAEQVADLLSEGTPLTVQEVENSITTIRQSMAKDGVNMQTVRDLLDLLTKTIDTSLINVVALKMEGVKGSHAEGEHEIHERIMHEVAGKIMEIVLQTSAVTGDGLTVSGEQSIEEKAMKTADSMDQIFRKWFEIAETQEMNADDLIQHISTCLEDAVKDPMSHDDLNVQTEVNQELSRKLEDALRQIEVLESKINELEPKTRELENEKAHYSSMCRELETRMNSITEQRDEVFKQLEEAKKNLETVKEQGAKDTETASEMVGDLTSQLSSVRERLVEIEAQRDALRHEVEELKKNADKPKNRPSTNSIAPHKSETVTKEQKPAPTVSEKQPISEEKVEPRGAVSVETRTNKEQANNIQENNSNHDGESSNDSSYSYSYSDSSSSSFSSSLSSSSSSSSPSSAHTEEQQPNGKTVPSTVASEIPPKKQLPQSIQQNGQMQDTAEEAVSSFSAPSSLASTKESRHSKQSGRGRESGKHKQHSTHLKKEEESKQERESDPLRTSQLSEQPRAIDSSALHLEDINSSTVPPTVTCPQKPAPPSTWSTSSATISASTIPSNIPPHLRASYQRIALYTSPMVARIANLGQSEEPPLSYSTSNMNLRSGMQSSTTGGIGGERSSQPMRYSRVLQSLESQGASLPPTTATRVDLSQTEAQRHIYSQLATRHGDENGVFGLSNPFDHPAPVNTVSSRLDLGSDFPRTSTNFSFLPGSSIGTGVSSNVSNGYFMSKL